MSQFMSEAPQLKLRLNEVCAAAAAAASRNEHALRALALHFNAPSFFSRNPASDAGSFAPG
jgi:hypothetical protein